MSHSDVIIDVIVRLTDMLVKKQYLSDIVTTELKYGFDANNTFVSRAPPTKNLLKLEVFVFKSSTTFIEIFFCIFNKTFLGPLELHAEKNC